jgi:hypothetical protein
MKSSGVSGNHQNNCLKVAIVLVSVCLLPIHLCLVYGSNALARVLIHLYIHSNTIAYENKPHQRPCG